MADLRSKVTDIMLEAHDLLQMASIIEDHAMGMFLEDKKNNRFVAIAPGVDQIRFGTRDVRGRAEALHKAAEALVEEMEAANG